MNFAFPAFFILLLVLPGVLLRLGYYRGVNLDGGWKPPFSVQTLGDEITWSSLFAGILHFLWVSAWCQAFHRSAKSVVENALILLVSPTGNNGNNLVKQAIEQISQGAGEIFVYFFSLSMTAYALGLGSHWLVRHHGLDHRFSPLRFDHPWFYILSGELISPLPPERPQHWRPSWWPGGQIIQADVVQISAVVRQGDDVYIYIGILRDYEFDRTGQLDRLLLSATSRRLLSKDKQSTARVSKENGHDDRFYPIESFYFIIRYSDICTLNIVYSLFEDLEEQPPSKVLPMGKTRPDLPWPGRLGQALRRALRKVVR